MHTFDFTTRVNRFSFSTMMMMIFNYYVSCTWALLPLSFDSHRKNNLLVCQKFWLHFAVTNSYANRFITPNKMVFEFCCFAFAVAATVAKMENGTHIQTQTHTHIYSISGSILYLAGLQFANLTPFQFDYIMQIIIVLWHK